MKRFIAGLAALAASGVALAQGVTDAEIVLGQSAPLSGPAEQLGRDMRQGALLYFNKLNARGGVNGRRVELKTLDDGYEPPRAAENTRRLIDQDRVFALFGYVGTPTSQASLPIFTEARVPFVGAFTGAQLLREPFNPYIFNIRASYYDETEAIVQHLTATSIDRIAVFYQDDAYGQAGLAGVERALAKRKLAVLAKGTVQRNTVEVKQAVATLSKADAQAVVMICAYKSCAQFIREMKKAGSAPHFWNVSFVGSRALEKELGRDARGVEISQVVPFPWDNTIPIVHEYRKALQEAGGGGEPSFGTLEGYIAAKVTAEGLRRAGRNLTRDSFIRAMESMGDYDVGGFRVTFGPNDHDASTFVDLTLITKDGKFMH